MKQRREAERQERLAAELKRENASNITSLNSNGTIKKITENGYNHKTTEYSSKYYLQSNGNGTAELTYRNIQK